jgi:transcriptional regulator with GAF, ATPase, and Fis domain
MVARTDAVPSLIAEDDAFLLKFLPGNSVAMRDVRTRIGRLNAPRNRSLVRNILICGESGAGKNYVSQVTAAHSAWLLAKNSDHFHDTLELPLASYLDSFVELNVPGIPEQLIESELFGYEKGAFTGADKTHVGYFGQGYHDILLDEIGDASLTLQAKLLRVLNSGEYRPLGGDRESDTTTDARILMATNKNLAGMSGRGDFREDLLWRVNEFRILVPPLREQLDNLPQIISNVLGELFEKQTPSLEGHPKMSEADLEWARSYRWPGNVRQLRHALVRWLLFEGSIRLSDIAQEIEREQILFQSDNPTFQRLRDNLRLKLDDARRNRTQAAPTVKALIDEYGNVIRKTLAEWLQQADPNPQELQAMFPETSGANSIRSQINKWQ